MATYKVIKAHDGLKLGDIKVLEPSSITAYMVENGYWEEVKDEPTESTVNVKPAKKKSK